MQDKKETWTCDFFKLYKTIELKIIPSWLFMVLQPIL